jgi:hypothetical protein
MNIVRLNHWFAFLLVGLTLFVGLSPAAARTSRPPIATPAPTMTVVPTLPKALFGVVWERRDSERGQLWLRFFESGKYVAGHGPLDTLDGVVHSGNYLFKDDVLTFKDGWKDCNGMRLKLRLTNSDRWLYLDPVTVKCDDRGAFAGYRWNRYAIKS